MLTQIAEGVWVHESEFCQSNAVIVQGRDGVLLVDAGIRGDEMERLADDLSDRGQVVVAGFSTHPHWDHLLWHARLGEVPRYGTARCAATVRERLSGDVAAVAKAAGVPEGVPLELLGDITGLPDATTHVPWDGLRVRIVEHEGHAPGHAALLIEERGVLIAGDMLSDVLIPMVNFAAADPIEGYLAALDLLERTARDADVVVPGHGSVGRTDQIKTRIKHDGTYVHGLRDGRVPDDARIGPSAKEGWEWVAGVHAGQLQRLTALERQKP